MDLNILSYNIHGLPWAKNYAKEILEWLVALRPPIICLQEVFTSEIAHFLQSGLEIVGYKVILPRDKDVAWLPSGLFTAVYETKYTVVNDCFYPFLDYHNIECFSNKGFHLIRCVAKDGNAVNIVNTHTQSDWELSMFFRKKIHTIRKAQMNQIADICESEPAPVFVVGDMNCEYSPTSRIRFMRFFHNLFQKTTFNTGEDLDHIAWLPYQWAFNCSFCNIDNYGPILKSCKIFDNIHWSDHYPIQYSIDISYKNFRSSIRNE